MSVFHSDDVKTFMADPTFAAMVATLSLENTLGFGKGFFLAIKGAAQSITEATWTKVQLNSEVFDPNGDYDKDTNYRHTPTIAGKWLYIGQSTYQAMEDGKQVHTAINLNAEATPNGQYISTGNASNSSAEVSTVAIRPHNMNGTSDFVELYTRQDDTVARNTCQVNPGGRQYLLGIYLGPA